MPTLQLLELAPRALWTCAVERLLARAAPPLSVQVVVAASSEVARRLVRGAAERAGAAAGIVPATFPELARDLAAPCRGDRLLDRAEIELIVAALLARDPGPFGGQRAVRPAVVKAVARTLGDLREAGATRLPPAEELEPELRPAAPRLEHLRRLLAAFERHLEQHRLADDAALYRAAAGAPPPAGLAHLLVYGVYDLTGGQRDLVAALARSCDVTWLLPQPPEDSPARAIVENTAQTLENFGFERTAPGTPPEEVPAPRILACPGEEAEAREVARDILLAAERIPFGEMAVLLAGQEALEPTYRRTLERAGIPVTGEAGERWADRPAGRTLRALVDLLAGEGGTEAAALLLSAGDDTALPAGRVPALLRAAGCVGRPDPERWARSLEAFAAGWERKAARLARANDEDEPDAEEEEEDRSAGVTAAYARRTAERARRLADRVRTRLTRIARFRSRAEQPGLTWREIGAELPRLAREVGLAGALAGAIADEAARLAGCERLGVPPHLPLALALLADRVLERRAPERDGSEAPPARRQGEAVLLLDLNRARGLTARAAWVAGLALDRFGTPGAADPLLDDRLRGLMRGTTGIPLKPAVERAQEADLLFELACAAGRERLTLSWSRSDDVTGALRHPADPLAVFIERLARERGEAHDRADPSTASSVTRVPVAPPRETDRERPLLDAAEYDRVLLGAAPERAGHLKEDDRFSRALAFQRARWSRPQLGEADGIVGRRDRPPGPLTPSALAELADCPFRYFLHRELDLAPWDDAALELAPRARDLGQLAHRVLESLFRKLGGEGSAPPMERVLGDLDRLLAREVERLAPADPAVARLWRAAAQEVRARVTLFLHEELRRLEEEGTRPEAFEQPLQGEVDLGETRIVVSGRADRIDRRAEGHEIVDYKWTKKTSIGTKGRLLLGGRGLQLPLYAAIAGEAGFEVASVRLALLKAPEKSRVVTRETIDARDDEMRALIGRLLARAEKGEFFPVAAERCRHCEFVALCGPARLRLDRRKADDPRLAGHRALEETYR